MRQTARKAACRLRFSSTLSQSRNHTVVGSLCSSRVSMRSVQVECSTHHHRGRVSPACGGPLLSPATAAVRLLSSLFIDLTLPLSYAPWLHPDLIGTSSLLWALCLPPGGSLDLVAMNTFWSRWVSLLVAYSLPTLLSPTTPPPPSCHLGSSTVLSAQDGRPLGPVAGGHQRDFSPMGLGPGFAQRSQARQLAWPNRVHFVSCASCHVVTDGLFTSGSSPPRVATTQ